MTTGPVVEIMGPAFPKGDGSEWGGLPQPATQGFEIQEGG